MVDVAVQPRRLSFGQVSKRQTDAMREFTVKVTEPDKVKITKVSVDDGRFALKLKEGEPAGDATYELVFKGSKELGRLTGKVRIEFSGSDIDHLDVPLWGQIVGDLRYPQNLVFYKDKDGFKEREVNFTSRTGEPVHLLGIKDEAKHLKVDIVSPKGKMAVIKVTVAKPDAEASKPLRGKLVVRTTDPDEPEVEMTYAIHHQRGRLGVPLSPGPVKRTPLGSRAPRSRPPAPAGPQ